MAKLYRKTKFKVLKFLSLLISSFLGSIFGFGCLPFAVEYGAPHADYKISGTIKAKDSGEKIGGIEVSRYSVYDTLYDLDSMWCEGADTTDSLGRYTFEFSDGNNQWVIRAKDIDGDENGSFIQKDTIIEIPHSDLKGGDGDWYEGKAEKTIDIDLEENS